MILIKGVYRSGEWIFYLGYESNRFIPLYAEVDIVYENALNKICRVAKKENIIFT